MFSLRACFFLSFINNIDVICHECSRIKLFSDDLKVYNIADISNPTATLQLSFDQLVKWSAEWQLPINIKTCSVITINIPRLTQLATIIR